MDCPLTLTIVSTSYNIIKIILDILVRILFFPWSKLKIANSFDRKLLEILTLKK